MRSGGQVVAVGDSRQAIYAYAGADPESLQRFQDAFETGDPLPLSTTWRCPMRHVSFVNGFPDGYSELLQSLAKMKREIRPPRRDRGTCPGRGPQKV